MEFMDVVRARHSVRSFVPEAIERSVIEELVSAAAMAPSSRNEQPWRFIVATGKTRDRIIETMGQTTVYLEEYVDMVGRERIDELSNFYTSLGDPPVVIAVTMPKSDDELTRLNNCISLGAALENFMLAAADKGLATCNVTFSFWVRDELAATLGVEEDRSIVSLLLLGKPAEVPVAPEHRMDLAVFLD